MKTRAALVALATAAALILTGCSDNTDCDSAPTAVATVQAAPARTGKTKQPKVSKPKAPKPKPAATKTIHHYHDHDDCEDDD